jgi:hypothetical protein
MPWACCSNLGLFPNSSSRPTELAPYRAGVLRAPALLLAAIHRREPLLVARTAMLQVRTRLLGQLRRVHSRKISGSQLPAVA